MYATAATGFDRSDSTLWGRIGWGLMLLGALYATAHAVDFVFSGSGIRNPYNPGQWARMFSVFLVGAAHTLGGAFASIIGPFQFLGGFRRRYPRLHVWSGRVYLVCVGVSGLAGLYLSPGSMARNTFGIAFIGLALAWLYTGVQAYLAIRRRRVDEHRRWMIRNYALTYAAVTLRFEMPLLIVVAGLTPLMALNVVGWLCWVPNLALVELWIRRKAA